MLKPLNMKNKKKPFVHSDHPAAPFYGLYSGRSGCGEGVRTEVSDIDVTMLCIVCFRLQMFLIFMSFFVL